MSTTHRVIPLVPVTTSAGGPGIEPAVKIQARHVSGRYARWRWGFVWLTQALFHGLPWLNWHGRQAVLFDLDARRFYLFDAVLFPQDLIHLTGLLVFSALLLFAATAVAGRVWCGFACPQTVYTALFMWIEQRSEGDRLARLRLDAAPGLDARSLVVGHDLARGEPRSARARGDQARSDARSKGLGDCVDCTLCVQVCPVAIDIRHGLQAACISCGLCIDACNNVMDKLGAPRGLVRFGAMQTAEQARRAGADGWRHAVARPRVLVYGVSLLLLAAAMGWGWAQRPQLRLNAMRDRGVLARQVDDGAVENVDRLQVMNASLQPRQLRLQALAGDAADTTALQVQHRGALAVDAAGATTWVVTVRMRAEQAQRHPRSRPVPIRLVVDDLAAGVQAQTATTFLPG